ncbi:hypothetical protein ACFL6C_12610 [Myxococcota bacterium]
MLRLKLFVLETLGVTDGRRKGEFVLGACHGRTWEEPELIMKMSTTTSSLRRSPCLVAGRADPAHTGRLSPASNHARLSVEIP